MGLTDYSETSFRSVTVFGASATSQGTTEWTVASRMGELIALDGFAVVTGGYCGSMEAVSAGARGAAQGTPVIGVTAPSVFPQRRPNPHLTCEIDTGDVMSRIACLIEKSRYCVALPGSLGTLQEIVSIWTAAMLHRTGPGPVIIAFRDPWERCLRDIAQSLRIDDNLFRMLHFVDTPEEAMQIIRDDSKKFSPL